MTYPPPAVKVVCHCTQFTRRLARTSKNTFNSRPSIIYVSSSKTVTIKYLVYFITIVHALVSAGHDYTGRSSGQHGFALWTHGLQGISRNQAFVPNNCSIAPQDSISLESGVQWETAYKFADEEGVIIVGGDSNQVGAGGGWLLGGGHSILSPTYGLGVDNLLEVDIVTADGKLHTISECSDPDLFW